MIKLFKQLKPFRVAIGAVLILVFLQSMGDLYLPTLMSDIVDKGIVQGDRSFIWKIGSFMLLVAGAGLYVQSLPAIYRQKWQQDSVNLPVLVCLTM